MAGVLGAWVGGMTAWSALDDPTGPGRKVKGDAGYTPNANTAFAIGSWLGSATGAWLAGSSPMSCGNFARAAGYSLAPSALLFFGREEPYLPLMGVVFAAPFQALAATLGDQR